MHFTSSYACFKFTRLILVGFITLIVFTGYTYDAPRFFFNFLCFPITSVLNVFSNVSSDNLGAFSSLYERPSIIGYISCNFCIFTKTCSVSENV